VQAFWSQMQVLLVLSSTLPWLVAIAWYWRRLPRDGALPLSMAAQHRRRYPR
jgi:hypothetical protein